MTSEAKHKPKTSCFDCRFELSCGYSNLARLGHRQADEKKTPCCLGKMTSGKPFFQPKSGSALWAGCDPADVDAFRKLMKERGHLYEFSGTWNLTDEGQTALANFPSPPVSA